MSKFDQLMISYGAYHKHPTNKLCHFVGVPLVMLSLFIPLGWFRLHNPGWDLSIGGIFFVATMIYYFRLNAFVAAVQLPFSFVVFLIAEWIAKWSFQASFKALVLITVIGWTVQLIGHYFEGKKPALADNIFQVFSAPLFLASEALFKWKHWRPDLEEMMMKG